VALIPKQQINQYNTDAKYKMEEIKSQKYIMIGKQIRTSKRAQEHEMTACR